MGSSKSVMLRQSSCINAIVNLHTCDTRARGQAQQQATLAPQFRAWRLLLLWFSIFCNLFLVFVLFSFFRKGFLRCIFYLALCVDGCVVIFFLFVSDVGVVFSLCRCFFSFLLICYLFVGVTSALDFTLYFCLFWHIYGGLPYRGETRVVAICLGWSCGAFRLLSIVLSLRRANHLFPNECKRDNRCCTVWQAYYHHLFVCACFLYPRCCCEPWCFVCLLSLRQFPEHIRLSSITSLFDPLGCHAWIPAGTFLHPGQLAELPAACL
ncbi:unnamed protein product [Trypanosoma congolense IL3000]|uniref:WGS project CAEQ00000000 data, annotated contig 1880 n=1 Tax=Trypanosoma congolense (strain IL3000) TaxID=1068625 RepID=F9W9M5_TRYCI|nr:unnamed protein product [Trypanosoma congolense IL3000]